MQSGNPYSVGLALFILIMTCDKLNIKCNKTENAWRKAGRLTGLLLQNCMQRDSNGPQEKFLLILQRCLKRRSLVALDRSLQADVISLASGVELVRFKNDSEMSRELGFFLTTYKSSEKDFDWKNQILRRIAHVLETHVLKIRLNGYKELSSLISVEGRRRRKNHDMFMSLLMFGIAAVALIIVPMGFQFLAVLGGKALLLAKMALILTAIQGLKKIATSNLNYGLYATTPQQHHQGLCKDESCSKEHNSLEVDDSVYVALDVDELSYLWHYDRQWPYGAESHDVATPHNNFPVVHENSDLLHPLQPRVETFNDIM